MGHLKKRKAPIYHWELSEKPSLRKPKESAAEMLEKEELAIRKKIMRNEEELRRKKLEVGHEDMTVIDTGDEKTSHIYLLSQNAFKS